MKSYSGEPVGAGRAKQLTKLAIVDDDENDRSLMKRAVERSRDLECVGCYGGGVEALGGIPFSNTEVVLMDVWMPDMSGFECTRRLKDIRPPLFVVMISGLESPEAARQARQAGADTYLPKPISLGRLLEAMKLCPRFRELGLNENPTSRNSQEELSIDNPTVRNALRRMVVCLEENCHAREDLLQEAWLHFWSMTRHIPGQRLGWYLQSVRFHLHHIRNSGRSLDSPKRRRAQIGLPGNCDAEDGWRDALESDEGLMSMVNAHDIFSTLVALLDPMEQKILGELVDGLGVCEIGGHLKMSHQSVKRCRKRIADLATTLGVTPQPGF